MKLNIDNEISNASFSSEVSVIEVIEKVKRELPSDRLVRDVVIDGKRFQRRQMHANAKLKSVEEIRICTTEKSLWAMQGTDLTMSQVERVMRSLMHSAELCHDQKSNEGLVLVARCLEGIECILDNLTLSRDALGVDFGQVQYEGIRLSYAEQELSRIFSEMSCAVRLENREAITDCIDFELLPLLHSLMKILRFGMPTAH